MLSGLAERACKTMSHELSSRASPSISIGSIKPHAWAWHVGETFEGELMRNVLIELVRYTETATRKDGTVSRIGIKLQTIDPILEKEVWAIEQKEKMDVLLVCKIDQQITMSL
ncbi:hypothetical protein V6N13_134745 [Hibiscus sabdariffa]|uniref:Uncharacterized protein n=1 Tax=Hibiscus sabdariffa TaxID=183260 RepID=A0ABR2R4N8_9ROSI